jgi:hypothetical protein
VYLLKESSNLYYHGSNKQFDVFNTRYSKRGNAIFLTKDLWNAQGYGNYIYTVELASNTKLFDYKNSTHLKELAQAILVFLEKEKTKRSDLRKSFYPYTTSAVLDRISKGVYYVLGHPIITECLKKLKYDGWFELENPHTPQLAIFNIKKLSIVSVKYYGK